MDCGLVESGLRSDVCLTVSKAHWVVNGLVGGFSIVVLLGDGQWVYWRCLYAVIWEVGECTKYVQLVGCVWRCYV